MYVHFHMHIYICIVKADIEEIFEGHSDLQAASMNNNRLCTALINRMKVEKFSRLYAYRLMAKARMVGGISAAYKLVFCIRIFNLFTADILPRY